MRNLVAIALLLALAGCAERDVATPPARPDAMETDAPALARPSPQAARNPQEDLAPISPSSSTPAPGQTGTLALEGEGLRAFVVATGASRAIPFGITKADALRMLQAVQGAPPAQQGENIDCGATNAIWADGLTVWFAGDRFVGWSVASPTSRLATAGGLAPGATRLEVENGASVATIRASSLGEEFTAGGVAGLLGSPASDARVTHLWAGAACVAR